MIFEQWVELWHEEARIHNDFAHQPHPWGKQDYLWEIDRHKKRVAELEDLKQNLEDD
jgi:hypothetical protein